MGCSLALPLGTFLGAIFNVVGDGSGSELEGMKVRKENEIQSQEATHKKWEISARGVDARCATGSSSLSGVALGRAPRFLLLHHHQRRQQALSRRLQQNNSREQCRRLSI